MTIPQNHRPKNPEKTELLPGDKTAQAFLEFFNHRFNFIKAPNTGEESPQWKTISDYPIEHRNLWNAFCSLAVFVGLSFAPTTHYALLDIDARSPYHPDVNDHLFRDLLWAFEDVGFNDFIILQSSKSKGIHVYLILPSEVPSHKLAVMLKLTAIRSGFIVKDGTLEIFPNAKPYNKKYPTPYKAHRLPLQQGSFLLDGNFSPYSDSIKTFLDLADEAAAAPDLEVIEAAILLADKTKAFRYIKGNGQKAAQFANDLKEQMLEGWTDFGQTNDLLRIIGTYGRVFEALGGKELADYIATTAQSLPGYHEFCRHQHHIDQRAKDWARCVEKFYYPYGSDPVRVGSFKDVVKNGSKENKVNNHRQKSAVERIKEGVNYLQETLEELPKKVGEMKEALLDAISSLFNVRPSDKTLNKHRDLWHPKFILQEEIVVVPQNLQEEVAETVKSHEEEEQPSEPSPSPELAPEDKFEPCHTPPEEGDQNGPSPNPPKTFSAVQSKKSATPPLYMKVSHWTETSTVLEYQGDYDYFGLVLLKGEKRAKIESIKKNQKVIINSLNHSSFLFNPEDSENLMVYVIPIEDQTTWTEGVMVKAMYLVESSSFT